MEKEKHNNLSPSSSHRWLSCPASKMLVQLGYAVEDDSTSPAAKEGTQAHLLASKTLDLVLSNNKLGDDNYIAETISLQLQTWSEDFDLLDKEEAKEAVFVYVKSIRGIIEKIPPYKVMKVARPKYNIEQYFELDSDLSLGGTVDFCYLGEKDGKLIPVIVDFKYGLNVVVDVKDNPQLLYYLACFENTLSIEAMNGVICIVQPRVSNDAKIEIVSKEDLKNFESLLLQKASYIKNSNYVHVSDYAEGSWCKFCGIKPYCKLHMGALAKEFDLVTLNSSTPINGLTDDQIYEVLKAEDKVLSFFKSLKEYAKTRIENNNAIEGTELKSYRNDRVWTDCLGVVEETLKENDIDLYDHKVITKSVAAVEKELKGKVGKEEAGKIVSSLITFKPTEPKVCITKKEEI